MIRTLLALFFLLQTVFSQNDISADHVHELSVFAPFNSPNLRSHNWNVANDAYTDLDNIYLTNDLPNQRGQFYSKNEVNFRNWVVEFEFKLHTDGTNRQHGDGFGFWYSSNPYLDSGSAMGADETYRGLFVAFDTFQNDDAGRDRHMYPYVSAHINNGDEQYLHDQDGYTTEVGGCHMGNMAGGHDYKTVRVYYYGSQSRLRVDFKNEQGRFFKCFDTYGIKLPTMYYLGFSGMTGMLSQKHSIRSVMFYSLDREERFSGAPGDFAGEAPSYLTRKHGQKSTDEKFKKERKDRKDRKERKFGDSWVWQLLKVFFGLVIVGVVILIIVVVYQLRRQNRRKRLY